MRKEINLSEAVVERLSELAAKKKWSLKKFMEDVLIRKSLTTDTVRYGTSKK